MEEPPSAPSPPPLSSPPLSGGGVRAVVTVRVKGSECLALIIGQGSHGTRQASHPAGLGAV